MNRIVGSTEDINYVNEHLMKKKIDENEVNAGPVTATPARDERSNERRCEIFLSDEASKLAYVEKKMSY